MAAGRATNAAAAAAAVILFVRRVALLIFGSFRLNGLVGRFDGSERDSDTTHGLDWCGSWPG
jgi:hypothetical protein